MNWPRSKRKHALATELRTPIEQPTDKGAAPIHVQDVLFTEFVVQCRRGCALPSSTANGAHEEQTAKWATEEFYVPGGGRCPPHGRHRRSPTRTPSDSRAWSAYVPYNIATQERIVRGRMPGLEIINDHASRASMRVGIFNFMRRSAEISVGR